MSRGLGGALTLSILAHSGAVATIGVVNLFLSSGPAATGDWLVVHMRPEYTSIVILRREDMIFFRKLLFLKPSHRSLRW